MHWKIRRLSEYGKAPSNFLNENSTIPQKWAPTDACSTVLLVIYCYYKDNQSHSSFNKLIESYAYSQGKSHSSFEYRFILLHSNRIDFDYNTVGRCSIFYPTSGNLWLSKHSLKFFVDIPNYINIYHEILFS